MTDRSKRCTECGERYPATTDYFHAVKSRGRTHNQWGEQFLRSACIWCRRAQNQEWAKKNRVRTPEDRERYRKMAQARDAAYRRLASINEEGFKILYAEELKSRGVYLKKYMGPLI